MNQIFLLFFICSSLIGVGAYLYDRKMNNPEIPKLMNIVWFLTIIYSGIFGFAIYYFTGRKQISTDSLYRRAARSTAHCYSGCGLGEIVGVVVAVSLFFGTTNSIVFFSFFFAYVFGFSLTVGPLIEDGVDWVTALIDSVKSETLSITVMESAAIGTDLYILSNFTETTPSLSSPTFWIALFISLTIGFIVAYPVNILLIKRNVKSGMMNPQNY